MLKVTFILAVVFLAIFIGVNIYWRYLQKKRREREQSVQYEDPKYMELEKEKTELARLRGSLELEHPYNRIVLFKSKLEKAEKNGDAKTIAEMKDSIELLEAKYKADEQRLYKAYIAQLEAVSRRLAQIELEERAIKLNAKKIVR
jgi:hypothetical protein